MKALGFSIALLAALPAQATSQMPEWLVLDGIPYPLHTQPLRPLLDDPAVAERLALGKGMCTAAWRNYEGTWTIRDGRLYLQALRAEPCDKPGRVIPLEKVEPAAAGPVPATWFTGSLMVAPESRRLYPYFGKPQPGIAYRVIGIAAGAVVSDTPAGRD